MSFAPAPESRLTSSEVLRREAKQDLRHIASFCSNRLRRKFQTVAAGGWPEIMIDGERESATPGKKRFSALLSIVVRAKL